jgi:hypothetical protein
MDQIFLKSENIFTISAKFPHMKFTTIKTEMREWDGIEYFKHTEPSMRILAQMNSEFEEYYKKKMQMLNAQKPNYIGGIPRDESMQTHEDRLLLEMMGPYANQKATPPTYDGYGYGMTFRIKKPNVINIRESEISHLDFVEHHTNVDPRMPLKRLSHSNGILIKSQNYNCK